MQNMSSKPRISILKKDSIGRNYFDMEDILTRSLYKVLNSGISQQTHLSPRDCKERFGKNVAVARPNNHKIGDGPAINMDAQVKLLAQEIFIKVERKYEKKLEEVREKDKKEIEQRLGIIKSELEAKYKIQLGKAEREKIRAIEQLAEKEKHLEHKYEMLVAEKEHDIEARRRVIENRTTELLLNKDNFERVKDEWKRKMESEMEEIRLEREKNSVNMVYHSARQKSEVSNEYELTMWKNRTKDLEKESYEARKKMAEIMSENFRLMDKLADIDHLKKELEMTVDALNDTKECYAECRLELRRTADFDQLKEENKNLKNEIEKLKLGFSQRVYNAIEEKTEEFREFEEKYKRMLASAKTKVEMLSEKCRRSEMERDLLKQEIKSLQKLVSKDSIGIGNLKSKRATRKQKPQSVVSDSSSSLSDGEMEILNIRQRIQNLDEIAKELDASVEHFSYVNQSDRKFSEDETNLEMYDDFCRAIQKTSFDKHGSPTHKTSSPQKPKRESRRNSELKESPRMTNYASGIRVVSPLPIGKNGEGSPHIPSNELKKDEVNHMSDFEKKMAMRENQGMEKRMQMMRLVESNEQKPESPKSLHNEPTTSTENPMFSGVDPIMASYMERVMKDKKSNEPEERKSNQVEISMGEELELEKLNENTKDDEDWW